MYIIRHINTQPLILVTVSPLLPMSNAKLSCTPVLWQSSHKSPPWPHPTYPCLSTPLSGSLTAARSEKGLLTVLVSLWAMLHISGLPRPREQFLTPLSPRITGGAPAETSM